MSICNTKSGHSPAELAGTGDPSEHLRQKGGGVKALSGQPRMLVIGQIHTHQHDAKYAGLTVSVVIDNKKVNLLWSNKASFYTQYRTPSSFAAVGSRSDPRRRLVFDKRSTPQTATIK